MRGIRRLGFGILLVGAALLSSITAAVALEFTSSPTEVGPGETLVKVLALPRQSSLTLPDGRAMDLGYKFDAEGGQWVGHIGEQNVYMPLAPEQVDEVVQIAGLNGLPTVPNRPAAGSDAGGGGTGFSFDAVWLLLILGAVGFGAWRFSVRISKDRIKTSRASIDDAADATISALAAGTPRPMRARSSTIATPAAPAARGFGGKAAAAPARPLSKRAGPSTPSSGSAFGRRS